MQHLDVSAAGREGEDKAVSARKGNFSIMFTPALLAGVNAINAENAIRALILSRSSVSEVLILGGALFLVALIFFAWAVIFRLWRPRRLLPHHPKLGPKHHEQPSEPVCHPTLAEAGGLPPIRNKRPPPSTA
jgi:hypothetical protein